MRNGADRKRLPSRGHKPTEQEPCQKKDVAPIERFKQAQREFIKVAGKFDLDRDARLVGRSCDTR